MKKKILGKKLSRSRTARLALYRSLTKALFEHGNIVTTLAKAKASQRFVDKLLGNVKGRTLAERRRVLARLGNDRKTTSNIFKMFEKTSRLSGFTRIIRLPKRKGDNAEIAKLELVEKLPKETEKKEPKKKEDKKNVTTKKKSK